MENAPDIVNATRMGIAALRRDIPVSAQVVRRSFQYLKTDNTLSEHCAFAADILRLAQGQSDEKAQDREMSMAAMSLAAGQYGTFDKLYGGPDKIDVSDLRSFALALQP
ncbi:MAG: hypothetical protein ACFB11_06385 [Paracoccaceae bacterium]